MLFRSLIARYRLDESAPVAERRAADRPFQRKQAAPVPPAASAKPPLAAGGESTWQEF